MEFREKIEAPWFRYWLHGKGEQVPVEGVDVPDRIEHVADVRDVAAARRRPRSSICSANGVLSFDAPPPGDSYVQYISDPANPVPYRPRPISPTYPAGDWRRWEVGRSAVRRRTVPTWRPGSSRPLDRDLTVTGELAADLFASTSGTDSDFVVKLIDVYPENAQANAWDADAGPRRAQYAQSLNGYELPIAMEVRRGRYNKSYEHPQPLVAEPADRIRDPAAQPRSRVPEGAPAHGAGAVDLVPA